MNLYFILFSVYAAAITPLTLRFRLRLGKQSGYRLQLQAAGLPFVRRRTSDDHSDEQPIQEQDVAQTLAGADMTLIRALLRPPVLRRLWQLFSWRELELYIRFSFVDAAYTALGFCMSRTLFQTLQTAGALPPIFKWRTEADFNAQGSELLFQGIVTFRLGSLLPAATTFALAYRRAQIGQRKVERHAAKVPTSI